MSRSSRLHRAALPLVAVLGAACGPLDPCDNEVVADVRSPGGRYRAVVFERGCGATVGFITQVSIVRGDAAGRQVHWRVDQLGEVRVHYRSDPKFTSDGG